MQHAVAAEFAKSPFLHWQQYARGMRGCSASDNPAVRQAAAILVLSLFSPVCWNDLVRTPIVQNIPRPLMKRRRLPPNFVTSEARDTHMFGDLIILQAGNEAQGKSPARSSEFVSVLFPVGLQDLMFGARPQTFHRRKRQKRWKSDRLAAQLDSA